MFGIRYFKAAPTTYVMQYQRGQIVRQGLGLSFMYFAPSSTLVAVPVGSVEVPFAFKELSADFQEITIQGQVTWRVTDAPRTAQLLDFSVKPNGAYVSEDPEKLPMRIVGAIQVQARAVIQTMALQQILRESPTVVDQLRQRVESVAGLTELGVVISDIAVLSIRPTPDTARALEATVREAILKQADDAIYVRRNSAIEQERIVKENELRTEVAVELKKREIRETQIEAERAVLEKRQEIERQQMAGRIEREQQNRDLVALAAENAKREADAKAYGLREMMTALNGVDPKLLQAITINGTDPAAVIALAFQGLADNAAKVGELNISPDLLGQLLRKDKR